MDPYLEGSLWQGFHVQLASEIIRQLMPHLRPRYTALMQPWLVVETPDEVVSTADVPQPDVEVGGPGEALLKREHPDPEMVVPLRLLTVVPLPIRQYAVEIRDTTERQLVTAIELLSPTTKRRDGRRRYLARRARRLLSPAHLLEIDLLRAGQRLPMRQPLPAACYFVFLGRASRRPITDVWPLA